MQLAWTDSSKEIAARLAAEPACGLWNVSKYDYTVGCFTHSHVLAAGRGAAEGFAWGGAVLLVNYKHAHNAMATVDFSAGTAGVRKVSQQHRELGPVSDDPPHTPGLQLRIAAGHGRVFVFAEPNAVEAAASPMLP